MGDGFEQARGIERPGVLENADHRRTLTPFRDRAPHCPLECAVGFAQRLRWSAERGLRPIRRAAAGTPSMNAEMSGVCPVAVR